MDFRRKSNFMWSYKIFFILLGLIMLKVSEVVILQVIIHWVWKIPLNGAEEAITIIAVFLIMTPFTFIVWKQRSHTVEAERRFRVLAEHSLVGIYTYYNGKFRYVNRRFLEKTGYKRDEIIGHSFHKLIVDEDLPILMESIKKRLNGEKDTTLQLRAIRKDKSIMDIEIFGTIDIRNGEPILMGSILDISERKRNEKLLNELVFRDPLTGVANRRFFENSLRKLIEEDVKDSQTSAVLFLDLDEFKRINDCFGHEAGDCLLIEMAKRIANCIRQEDTVARIAGDEFMILFGNTDKPSVIKIAEQIIQEVNKPFYIQENQISTSGSLGISFFPEHGSDPKTLIRKADAAMYKAKQQGKNTYHIYRNEG